MSMFFTRNRAIHEVSSWEYTHHVKYDGNNRTKAFADSEDVENSHEPEEEIHDVQQSGNVI